MTRCTQAGSAKAREFPIAIKPPFNRPHSPAKPKAPPRIIMNTLLPFQVARLMRSIENVKM